MKMTPFHTERTIRVYLPRDYFDSEAHYPVLYMHDGRNVFRDGDAIGGVSLGLELYLEKTSLELIVVGIDAAASREERIDEYCPWMNGAYSERIIGYRQTMGGKGNAYVDFLVNELKPRIDGTFRTRVHQTYLAGVSLGGLISSFAACQYPEVFRRVAGISSGFYRNQEKIEALLRESDLSLLERFYMDCGTEEAMGDPRISQEFVNSNKAIYDIVKSKVSHTHFQLVNGAAHNYSEFRKRIPDVFSFLFA
ncbi:alpha/beta hydrolase [Ferroacidibacillus organovorans]|nr:alpha/beta hydrolase-fold protein [Ferroacidibacillus organovorans]